jgi:hypothetical protein
MASGQQGTTPGSRERQETGGKASGESKQASGGSGSRGGQQGGGESQGGGEDLRQREYRDEKGNVHHHTTTYMEQHRGEK